MALAENHRAALKLEATTGTFPTPTSGSRPESSGRNRHQVVIFIFCLASFLIKKKKTNEHKILHSFKRQYF